MATTNIIDGNVYVTTGTVNGDTITHETNKAVEIFSARIEIGYINALGGIMFKSRGNTATNVARRIRDLKKIQKVIIVTGHLDDETSLKGITKRNNLLNMGEFDIGWTLVWGRGNYQSLFDASADVPSTELEAITHGVFILKMKFRETAGIYGSAVSGDPQPMTKHDVEIQFIAGKDI